MKTIEQENLHSTPSSLSNLGKLQISDDYDDFGYGGGFSMNRSSSKFSDDLGFSKDSSWVVVDDISSVKTEEKPPKTRMPVENAPVSDEARKKFGSAKAISSDQYFGDKSNDYEVRANLNRFQGSSSISSSDFFGNGKGELGLVCMGFTCLLYIYFSRESEQRFLFVYFASL